MIISNKENSLKRLSRFFEHSFLKLVNFIFVTVINIMIGGFS